MLRIYLEGLLGNPLRFHITFLLEYHQLLRHIRTIPGFSLIRSHHTNTGINGHALVIIMAVGSSTRKMDIGEKSAGYGNRSAMMFGKTVNLHPVHQDVTVHS